MKYVITTFLFLLSVTTHADDFQMIVARASLVAATTTYEYQSKEKKEETIKIMLSQLKQFDSNEFNLLSQDMNSLKSLVASSVEFTKNDNCKRPTKTYFIVSKKPTNNIKDFKCANIRKNNVKKVDQTIARVDKFILPYLQELENQFKETNMKSKSHKLLLSDLRAKMNELKVIKKDLEKTKNKEALKKIMYLSSILGA